MRIDRKVAQILEAVQEGRAPSQEACATLLAFPETTLESALVRAAGNDVTRRRLGSGGHLFGQIGIEFSPCPGECRFCSFAAASTQFGTSVMSDEEVLRNVESFTAAGELEALFFMTMHPFDLHHLLHVIELARGRVPSGTQIVVNLGDFDAAQARELKGAGVDGAYHVLRLREGSDTALDPGRRMETIQAAQRAGLDWWYCCEPIGPEHSPGELAEQIFFGVNHGCVAHAAMRRVYLPSSPLAARGQVSELRLAQVTAVVALATMHSPAVKLIAVHEPNVLGLSSGANALFAEAGANPRDTEENTTGHRGRDILACKKMLYEAGFDTIHIPAGKTVALADAYLASV